MEGFGSCRRFLASRYVASSRPVPPWRVPTDGCLRSVHLPACRRPLQRHRGRLGFARVHHPACCGRRSDCSVRLVGVASRWSQCPFFRAPSLPALNVDISARRQFSPGVCYRFPTSHPCPSCCSAPSAGGALLQVRLAGRLRDAYLIARLMFEHRGRSASGSAAQQLVPSRVAPDASVDRLAPVRPLDPASINATASVLTALIVDRVPMGVTAIVLALCMTTVIPQLLRQCVSRSRLLSYDCCRHSCSLQPTNSRP